MNDGERDSILEAIRQTARGEQTTTGRDEVGSGPRVDVAGMHGRSLECTVGALEVTPTGKRLALRVDHGEIVLGLTTTNEFVFQYGDLKIDAHRRAEGAKFVSAVASWLGTPLDSTDSPAQATEPILGSFAKLAERNDADGIRWTIYKLFIGTGDAYAEVFLRISTDGRAAFVEKWSRYREALLLNLDRCVGAGRGIAPRHVVDVFGGAQFTIRPDWLMSPQEGHMKVTDAADEVLLEISHQPFPLDPRLPGVAERVRVVLAEDHRDAAMITTIDRGDLELAWTEYDYEADDTKTGQKRLARGRIAIAANETLQVLITYYYWPADESWAASEWETMVSTLRLASRVPERGGEKRLENSGV